MTREEFKALMEEIRGDREDDAVMEAITRAVDDYDYMIAERDDEIASRDNSILELQEAVTRTEAERDEAKRRYYDLYTRFIAEEPVDTVETDLVDDDNEVYETTTYEEALKDWD